MGWELPVGLTLDDETTQSPQPLPSTTSSIISTLTLATANNQANNDGKILEQIKVSTLWLRASYPQTSTEALALFTIVGDFMEPSFKPQDTVLVDTSTCTVDQDGMYIFTYHDTLLIKRIQRRPGLGFMMISDNKTLYEQYSVPNEDLDNLTVHGRVIGKFEFKKIWLNNNNKKQISYYNGLHKSKHP